MKKGIFITLEGIDFSGKSTQARYLLKLFSKNNLECVFLREPGGTKLSERIRRILLSKGDIDISPKSELWLYLAARSQIVQEKIQPALKAGKIVLCDRFYDSTFAYQAYGRGLNKEFVMRAILYSADNLKPNLTILFDLPEKEAFRRKQKMSRSKDRLENEKTAFFKKVRKGYLKLAESDKKRIKIVDASASREAVRDEMTDFIVKFFKNHRVRISTK